VILQFPFVTSGEENNIDEKVHRQEIFIEKCDSLSSLTKRSETKLPLS
jgi:hypothetical protein